MKFETVKLNKIVIKEQIEILIQKVLSEIDPKFVENGPKIRSDIVHFNSSVTPFLIDCNIESIPL